MRYSLLLLGALSCVPAGILVAQDSSLLPYTMDWKNNTGAMVDASILLEAPAGKSGFLAIRDGHLVKPNGERFRIWGFNITAAATGPSKADAPMVAAYLARFGINCVRLHFLDSPAPAGLLARNRDDTSEFDAERIDRTDFDAERIDRTDFFIAELKKRGIYTDLNLNVGRIYKPGDGVRDIEYIGYGKALTYYDDRLLELQRDYARRLLTHYNPYTKTEYRNEPAIALVELVNENSIVESWVSNRLLGKNTRKNPGTWSDITESYEKDLTARYQAWLKARGSELMPRLRKEEFAQADPKRFRDEASFYMELEERFFQSMYQLLKKDLNVHASVLATSDHNHGISGYPLLHSAAKLDIVDGHIYWQHPRYLEDANGKRAGFSIGNTPMVNDPLHSNPVELSRSAVAGKPYTVSEVNHPFPAEYASEGIPILTAYAALQDWDGIFWYTFEHKDPSEWAAKQPSHFEFRSDPVKMTQLAAGAFLFLRSDLRPADRTVQRSYSTEQVLDSLRLSSKEAPYFTPGFPLDLPLRHASRIASLDKKGNPDPAFAAAASEAKDAFPIRSDTQQLAWYGKPGVVTIDTARTQALIGFNKAQPKILRNLAAEIDNEFSAITLTAISLPSGMCHAEIECGAPMLLSVGSRVANTGMQWNAKRDSLTDWGKEPTRIEPITGTILLRNMHKDVARIKVTPLDGAGHAAGAPVFAKKTKNVWRFPIGAVTTPWYLVEPQLTITVGSLAARY